MVVVTEVLVCVRCYKWDGFSDVKSRMGFRRFPVQDSGLSLEHEGRCLNGQADRLLEKKRESTNEPKMGG